MARNAEEIYKLVKTNKLKNSELSFRLLKEKAMAAVTDMIRKGDLVAEIYLTDQDMLSIVPITKELRSLNYYYCLIEVQSEAGDVIEYKLRISIEHLEKEYGQQEISKVSLEN